jgi:hypothetical protein
VIDPYPVNDRYRETGGLDVLNEILLMLRTALGKGFENRIPNLRLCQFAVSDLEVELRQVAAVQVTHKIGSAEVNRRPNLLH